MSPRNALNGAQVIVDYLIQEKVPQVFGLCGHGNIQFIDELYERSDELKTISVHHESVDGFMADVYYRDMGGETAVSAIPIASTRCMRVPTNSRPFRCITRASPASWRMSITAYRGGRPRPSR